MPLHAFPCLSIRFHAAICKVTRNYVSLYLLQGMVAPSDTSLETKHATQEMGEEDPRVEARTADGDLRPFRVATDCSGMEAPIQALRNLGVSFEHVFSSDKNKHARSTIRANFPSATLYEDMQTRNDLEASGCDLYIVGWPCQDNSKLGKCQGFQGERSKVFYSVVASIGTRSPAPYCSRMLTTSEPSTKGWISKLFWRNSREIAAPTFFERC